MKNTYYIDKKNYDKKDIVELDLIFDNGDKIPIKRNELIDLSIDVYDRLVYHNQGFIPVASSGYIKLKIFDKPRYSYGNIAYNQEEYKKNRKSYIEKRCSQECGIIEVHFYDENYWKSLVKGNIKSKVEGDFVILEFLPVASMINNKDKEHYVNVMNLNKDDISKMCFDLENGDVFTIYCDEIIEMNLNLGTKLIWSSGEFCRYIESGYMVFKFDKENKDHEASLLMYDKITIRKLQNRISNKKGVSAHDICRFYIDYINTHANLFEEKIEVEEIKDDSLVDELLDKEKETEEYYFYEGGYSARLKDGSILLTFGKNAKETIEKCLSNRN